MGIPDLRQRLQERGRPDVGRALHHGAPVRETTASTSNGAANRSAGRSTQPLDWNGSGMHSNFSTKHMREVGGKEYFEKLMAAFNKHMDEHIAVYGPENHLRLTGLHETQSIDKFTYGLADRGASVRMPHSFVNSGYKGYLEDRRPNSAADPVFGRRPDHQDDPDGSDQLNSLLELFLANGVTERWRRFCSRSARPLPAQSPRPCT